MQTYVLSLCLASVFACGCCVYGPQLYGPQLVAGGAGGGGGGGSGTGGSGGAQVDAGSDVENDVAADAGGDASDGGEADACVFDQSPTSCGCCFAANGIVVCPPGTTGLPDSGVITLPICQM